MRWTVILLLLCLSATCHAGGYSAVPTASLPINTRWQSVLNLSEPVYDVKAYGAVSDDGIDDTAAFKAAITAARAAKPSYSGIKIAVPSGKYVITSPLVLSDNEYLVGDDAYIYWQGSGFCIQMAGSYATVKGLVISITDTASAGGAADIDWGFYGGIAIGTIVTDTAATCIGNVIEKCSIVGTSTNYSDSDCKGIFLHGHRVDSSTYCAVYFNRIVGNMIRRTYDSAFLRYEANANYFTDNLCWQYYKYGININTGSQNQVSGGFFHAAPGRSSGDLTYAVRIGADATETAAGAKSPIYNMLRFGAEPGAYSSPLYNDGSSTMYWIENNTTHGTGGTGTPAIAASRSGHITASQTITAHGGFHAYNGATSAGSVTLYEDSDNGTNTVTLAPPDAMVADYTASNGTLVLDDGANWRLTLTIKAGAIVDVDSAGSTAATATWTAD